MSELPGVVFQNTGSGSPLWRCDGDVSEPEFFNKPLRVILMQLRVEWELLLPQIVDASVASAVEVRSYTCLAPPPSQGSENST